MVAVASKSQLSEQLVVFFLLTMCVAAQEPSIIVETSAGPDKYDFDMDDPHPIDQMAMETIIHQVYLIPDSNTSRSHSENTEEIVSSFFQINDSSVANTEALSTMNATYTNVFALNNYTVLDLPETDTPDLKHNSSNEDERNSTRDQLAIPSETQTQIAPASELPVYNITSFFNKNISFYKKSSEFPSSSEASLDSIATPTSANITADDATVRFPHSTVDAAEYHLPQTEDSLHRKRQATPQPNFPVESSNSYPVPVWDAVYKGIYPSRPFLLPENVFGPPKRPEPFVLRRNKPRVKGRKRVGATRPSQRIPLGNKGTDPSFSSDDSSADVSVEVKHPLLKEELSHNFSETPLVYEIESVQGETIATPNPDHDLSSPLSVSPVVELEIKYNSPKEVLQKFPPRKGVQPDEILSFIDEDSNSDNPLDRSVFPIEESQEKFTELEGIVSDQVENQPVYKHQNYYADSFRQMAYIPKETEGGNNLQNKTEPVKYPAQLSSEIAFSSYEDSKDEVFQFEESERDTFATQLGDKIPQTHTSQSSLLNINSDLYEGLRLPYYSLIDDTVHSNHSISVQNHSQIDQAAFDPAAQNLSKSESGFDIQGPESNPHALHEQYTPTAQIRFPIQVLKNSSNPVGATNFSHNFYSVPNAFTPSQILPGFQDFQHPPLKPHLSGYEPQLQDYYDPTLFEYLDAVYRAQAQGYHVPDYLYDYDYELDYINGQLGRPPLNQALSPPPPPGQESALHLPLDFNSALHDLSQKQNFLSTGSTHATNENTPTTMRGQNGEFLNVFQRPFQNPVEFVQLVNGAAAVRSQLDNQNSLRNPQTSQDFPTLFSQTHNAALPPISQGQTEIPKFPRQNVNEYSEISRQNSSIRDFLQGQIELPSISSQRPNVLLNTAQEQLSTQANTDPSQNEFIFTQQRQTAGQFGIPLAPVNPPPFLLSKTIQQGQEVEHFGNPLPTSPLPTLQSQTTSSNFPTTPRLRFTEDSILSIKTQTFIAENNNVGGSTSTPITQKSITLIPSSVEELPRSQAPVSHLPTSHHSAANLPNGSQQTDTNESRNQDLQIESPLGDRHPKRGNKEQRMIQESIGNVFESSTSSESQKDILEGPTVGTKASLSPLIIKSSTFEPEPAATQAPKSLENLENLIGLSNNKSRFLSSTTGMSQGSTDHEFAFGSGLVIDDEIMQQLHLLARDGALENGSILNSPLLNSIGIFKNIEEAIRNSTDPSFFISRVNSDEPGSVTTLKPEMAKISMNSLKKLMALKTSDASDIPVIIRNFIAAQRNFRRGEIPKGTTTKSNLDLVTNTQLQTSADVSTDAETEKLTSNRNPSDKKDFTGSQAHGTVRSTDDLMDDSEENGGEFIILLSNKSSIYPKDGEFIVIIPQPTWSPFFQEVFSTPKPVNRSARDGDFTQFFESLSKENHDEISDSSPQNRIHTTSRRGVPLTHPPSFVQSSPENESDIPLTKRRVSERRTNSSTLRNESSLENESKWFAPYSEEYGRRKSNTNKDSEMTAMNITGSAWINSLTAFTDFNNTEVEISLNTDPNEPNPSLNLTEDEKRGFTLEDYYAKYIPTTRAIPQALNVHLGSKNSSDYQDNYNHDNLDINIPDLSSTQQFGYFYEGNYPNFWSRQLSSSGGYPYLINPASISFNPAGLNESQNLVTTGSLLSESSLNEEGITALPDLALTSTFFSDGTYNNDNIQHQFNLPVTQHSTTLPKDTSDYSLKAYANEVSNSVSRFDNNSGATEANHDSGNNYVSTLLPNGIHSERSLEAGNISEISHITSSNPGSIYFNEGNQEGPISSSNSSIFATLNVNNRNLNYSSVTEPFVTTDIPYDDQPLLQHSSPLTPSGYVKEESLVFPVFDVTKTTKLLPTLQSTPFPSADVASESHLLLNKETTNDVPDSSEQDFLENIRESTILSDLEAIHSDFTQNPFYDEANRMEPEKSLVSDDEQILSSITDIMDKDTPLYPEGNIHDSGEALISFGLSPSAIVLGRENLASVEDFELSLINGTFSSTETSELTLKNSKNIFKSADKGNLNVNFTPEHLNASNIHDEMSTVISSTERIVPDILTDNSKNTTGLVIPPLRDTVRNVNASNVTIKANSTTPENNENKSDDLLSTETLPRDSRIVTIDLGIVPLNSLAIYNHTGNFTGAQIKKDTLDALTTSETSILSPDALENRGPRIEGTTQYQGESKNVQSSNRIATEFDNVDSDSLSLQLPLLRLSELYRSRNILDPKSNSHNSSVNLPTGNKQQELKKKEIPHTAEIEIANLDTASNLPSDGLDVANMSGLKVDLTLPGIQIIDVTPLVKQPGSSTNADISPKNQEETRDILKNDNEFLNNQVLIITDDGEKTQTARDPAIQGISLAQHINTNRPLVTQITNYASPATVSNYADYFIESPTADTESNPGSVVNEANADVSVRFNPIVNGDTLRNVNIESAKLKANINFNNPFVSDFSRSGADLFNSQEPIILLESPLKLESIEETPQQISGDDLTTFPHVVSSSIILADEDYMFSDDADSKENKDLDYSLPEPTSKLISNFDLSGSNSKLKIPGRVDNTKVTAVLPEVTVGTSIVKQQISSLSFSPTPTVGRITETTTTTVYVSVPKTFSSTATPQRVESSSKATQKTAFKPSSLIGSAQSGFSPSAPRFQTQKPFISASQSPEESQKWIWSGHSGLPLRKPRLGLTGISPSELIASEQSSLAPTYRDLPGNDASREKKKVTSNGKSSEERWVWDPVNRRGIPAESDNPKPYGIDEWLPDDYLLSPSVVSYLYRKLDEITNDNSDHDATPTTTNFSSTSATIKSTARGQFLWNNNDQHGKQNVFNRSAIDARASGRPDGFFPVAKLDRNA